MSSPSVVLGGAHIDKAVRDEKFFSLMPEFASIKAQINAMHLNLQSKKGCSTCSKRRLHMNIDSNFAAIASRLPAERAKTLKRYLGLGDDQKLFIRTVDPNTRQLVLKSY